MKGFLLLSFFIINLYAAPLTNLDMERAIEIVKKDNLEVNIAKFNEDIKALEVDIAKGYNYGKLNLKQNIINSNDPGNVFGFKLQSRDATFGDFGFDQFLEPMGQALNKANSGTLTNADLQNMSSILDIKPKNLNEPEARTHYQTKLVYELPLYTGGKLTEYKKISSMLYKLSSLDREKILKEKVYQTKKSFYDISLLKSYIVNLNQIRANILQLEDMVESMIVEGYAKRVDLLEVQAKRANVERMLNSAKSFKKLALDFLSFLLNTEVQSIQEMSNDAKSKYYSQEEIVKNSIDIKKAETGYKITQSNVELQKSPFLPEAGVFAEYGSANDEFLKEFADKSYYTIGVGIKWNIFNGGIDKANYEKAKVENLKVARQVEMAKKGVALKVSKILTEIDTLDFDINHLKKELELAREVYANYQGRYSENLISINDVLIKQAEEIEKVLKLQEAQNRRNEKIFLIEKIANKGTL